jgi:hypothetical protein
VGRRSEGIFEISVSLLKGKMRRKPNRQLIEELHSCRRPFGAWATGECFKPRHDIFEADVVRLDLMKKSRVQSDVLQSRPTV